MNYSTDDLLIQLRKKFNDIAFEYDEVEYPGLIPAFFIRAGSEDLLQKEWMPIVDFIGLNFQTALLDEFAVWNIYLFFVFPEKIDEALKYQIENNTFSSRKIVIERKMTNTEIIAEHIINNDLSFGKSRDKGATFQHNEILWGQLKNKDAKKKITDEDRAVFKNIVKTLKRKSDEN